jgi:hypothetical protein
MHELIPILIALACPLGMVAMMALPMLKRVFGRRADRAAVGAE